MFILLFTASLSLQEKLIPLLSEEYTVHIESTFEAIHEKHLIRYNAILVDIALLTDFNTVHFDQIKAKTRYLDIPIIAVSEQVLSQENLNQLDDLYMDYLSPPWQKTFVLRRIRNCICGRSSFTLQEIEMILKELPFNIYMKDVEGKYVFSTHYWHHLNGIQDPTWTIRGKTDLDIRKNKTNAIKAMESDRKIIETGKGCTYVIEEHADGIQEYLELTKCPTHDSHGNVNGIIALINNITDFHLLRQELEKRSKTDALTGLLNKQETQNLISLLLSSSQRKNEQSALMMIDVDQFKMINDTFGHAVGDKVLAKIGGILKNAFRTLDVVGRVGGDEFMVFIRSIKDTRIVTELARRLLLQIHQAFEHDSVAKYVSLSIGIACSPEDDVTFDGLYKAADQALYYVKQHGRGNIMLYSSMLQKA